MKCNAIDDRPTRRVWRFACAAALSAAFTVSLPVPARATNVTPPSVPDQLKVPDGNVAFLKGHGVGTQNYVCLPSAASATGFDWSLFTPEATLFTDDDKQLTTHFFGPDQDPGDKGVIRVAWQHSRDSSAVWAALFRDPVKVTEDAVPWLVLEKKGVLPGPTGGDTLTPTTFVQRVNTQGGVAPRTGCSSPGEVGARAFVPYEADYFFFRQDTQ